MRVPPVLGPPRFFPERNKSENVGHLLSCVIYDSPFVSVMALSSKSDSVILYAFTRMICCDFFFFFCSPKSPSLKVTLFAHSPQLTRKVFPYWASLVYKTLFPSNESPKCPSLSDLRHSMFCKPQPPEPIGYRFHS